MKKLLSPSALGDQEDMAKDLSDLIDWRDFYDYVVDVRHSQKAVKTGAIMRYRAMLTTGNLHVIYFFVILNIIENLKGIVGFGLGKSSTVHGAIAKARKIALRNIIAVPIYRGHTIYQAAGAKVTKTKVI